MKRITKVIIGVVFLLLFIGVIGFLGIQLIPVDRTNPPVVNEPQWDSPQTRALAERACFDCHSNETKWPWYSRIAPLSWLVVHDVQEGRAALNYSEWRPGQENESVEALLKGKMPPGNYILTHPAARLTSTEKQALIAGMQATFGRGETGEEHERESDEPGEVGSK